MNTLTLNRFPRVRKCQNILFVIKQVEFPILLEALNKFARSTAIDLLYINNSTIEKLTNNVFSNLKLHNVQLSSCSMKSVEDAAFKGQEKLLKNLNLQDNLLETVPIKALRVLSILNLLDLSKNRISQIPENAFQGLTKLSTLKLSDNNVTLAAGAFRGIENSLKNLNLKGTKQKRVPESVRGLKLLAFLDLSQNGIRELPGVGGLRTFEGLDSLTALNLERNLIQNLGEIAFGGVRKTLSSLSLLNNLMAEFPVGAIHSLKELRVLDIGFNLLTALPETAFRGNPSITLLALDGNPLPTVPEKALAHLNRTLRGLSLGGRFLHCDCKLKWVAEWIRNGDLQVGLYQSRHFIFWLRENIFSNHRLHLGRGIPSSVARQIASATVDFTPFNRRSLRVQNQRWISMDRSVL